MPKTVTIPKDHNFSSMVVTFTDKTMCVDRGKVVNFWKLVSNWSREDQLGKNPTDDKSISVKPMPKTVTIPQRPQLLKYGCHPY